MHWMNGEFHENITAYNAIYVNEHRHIGIKGLIDKTIYGEDNIKSEMRGNDVLIESSNGPIILNARNADGYVSIAANTYMQFISGTGILITANSGININGGSYTNIGTDNGPIAITARGSNRNTIIKAENGSVSLQAAGTDKDVIIESSNRDVIIYAAETIQLMPNKNLVVKNTLYGTSLPSSGETGQVFFKLIS